MTSVEKYDLLEKQAPFLDRQFVHVILKSAVERNIGDVAAAKAADAQVLASTLLVDEIAATGGAAGDLSAKKEQIAAAEASAAGSAPSLAAAQTLYAAGRYEKAIELLVKIRDLHKDSSKDAAKDATGDAKEVDSEYSTAVWGLFAARVMAGQAVEARADLPLLEELVSGRSSGDALHRLNDRTWLIHWLLFATFRGEGGLEKLIETLSQWQYMSTIQTSCPWILRYLAVAVLVVGLGHARSRQFQWRLNDLVRSVTQEQYEYSDPVLDFVVSLYVNYDFEVVGQKLQLALAVIEADYFTSTHVKEFADSARFLIANLYFQVHNEVSVNKLAPSLALSPEDAAKFVQGLVVDNKIDAALRDSNKDIYAVQHARASVANQVKDKIKAIEQRSKASLAQAEAKAKTDVTSEV